MGFSETSLKWRMSFFFQFLAFILMIAAVASTFMAEAELIPNKMRHIGFFDMCDDTQTFGCRDMVEYINSLPDDTDWVHGCRALVVLGIILQGVTMLVSLWMAFMASGVNIGHLITSISTIVAVIFNLIGGIVFLANSMDVLETTLEMDSDPSWSFAVLIIAQGFLVFSASLQLFEACTAD